MQEVSGRPGQGGVMTKSKYLTAKEVTCPLCSAPANAPCMSVRRGSLGSQCRTPHSRRVTEAVRLSPGPARKRSPHGGKPRHRFKGREFGALKVICLWGSQSGNLAWAYWCQACGHVGMRQAGKLNRGEFMCPRCGAVRKPARLHLRKPLDEALLAVLMSTAPPLPPERRRKPLTISRSLETATAKELGWLKARVEEEIERRDREAVVKARKARLLAEGRIP